MPVVAWGLKMAYFSSREEFSSCLRRCCSGRSAGKSPNPPWLALSVTRAKTHRKLLLGGSTRFSRRSRARRSRDRGRDSRGAHGLCLSIPYYALVCSNQFLQKPLFSLCGSAKNQTSTMPSCTSTLTTLNTRHTHSLEALALGAHPHTHGRTQYC